MLLQKAAKALAARNTATLNRTLLITLVVNVIFILFRVIIFKRSFTSKSLFRYILLSSPSWLVQFWFERIARPHYYPNGELKQSGEDLQAKGLTDWMWDVLYWTYGCVILAALVGDYAWWFWVSGCDVLKFFQLIEELLDNYPVILSMASLLYLLECEKWHGWLNWLRRNG